MPHNAQESPSEARAADPGTEGPPKGVQPAEGESPNEESFSREYVTQLRTEAKDARLKASRADFLATEVHRYAIKEAAAAAGLVDPHALTWTDDFDGDDGLPDHDRLRAAADALVAAKPWLARPRGDVGQGRHSDAPAAVSLSQLLRA